jgi:transposase InsO family protein
MPWKEHRTVDLREEFVLRSMAPGANIAQLSREYGISRKTGYKWIERFETFGVESLKEMSRRPHRVVETSGEIVLRIQELRRAHPNWGPKKLRVLLERGKAKELPSVKTIARILDRLGQPKLRMPRRRLQQIDRVAPKHELKAPNDLWTVDFKGWWHTRNGEHCEPLTIRDGFSRYVLRCQVMTSTAMIGVRGAFERLFQQHGLPAVILVDNGSPFGSTRARGGLTQLSAWWVAIGIRVVFSRPGQPQDNGAHERMHGDLSMDVERDPAASKEAQQRACDRWVHEFNHVRPHEALGMKTPAEIYERSTRPYRGVRAPRYRLGLQQRKVDCTGHIHVESRAPFVGAGFSGYLVGV